jgi:hypothetical protein
MGAFGNLLCRSGTARKTKKKKKKKKQDVAMEAADQRTVKRIAEMEMKMKMKEILQQVYSCSSPVPPSSSSFSPLSLPA